MKKELQESLFNDFPNLYRERTDKRKTNMAYGFCVGDGWEPIIRDLSQKLEALILLLPEEKRQEYWCCQVKEKFGGLRFYMNKASDEMYNLIEEAELAACKACSECGRPPTKATGFKTQCSVCYIAGKNEELAADGDFIIK